MNSEIGLPCCPECGYEFQGGEKGYEWQGKYICEDCLRKSLGEMKIGELAWLIGSGVKTMSGACRFKVNHS